jgi:hypothetical protein
MNQIHGRCILVLLLLLFAMPLLSQEVIFNRVPSPDEQPWPWITGITQDSRGFMWFSGMDGLYKHDGLRTTIYKNDPSNPNSISMNRLLCIHAVAITQKKKLQPGTLKTLFEGVKIIEDLDGQKHILPKKAEKKKQEGDKYEPIISVSRKKGNDKVLISVRDNGTGIPQKVTDKIFQPFFTTRPTGQGTGLGLSLSYDIIKAHGGEIKVETKEREGSQFIISLPALAITIS